MQADNLVVVSVKVREAFPQDSPPSPLNKTRAVPVYSHSLLCPLLLTNPAANLLLFSPVIGNVCLLFPIYPPAQVRF